MRAKSTRAKCEDIMKAILRQCDEECTNRSGKVIVGFSHDWSPGELVLFYEGSHNHLGSEGRGFPDRVEEIYQLLCREKTDPE